MYADKAKLDLKSLVFCFDGDKIGPAATPDALGMEDNDIIEVHVTSSWLGMVISQSTSHLSDLLNYGFRAYPYTHPILVHI